ncbi:MAG: rod shape-determining protein MreC [Candidatus Omnitrophota bacterium]|nr:rod shape-determining protein MreC [Candidatus Omnitrophota bacterium]MDD5654264.1 rod shape-determining protein MreC [Candidatus Omnitrophota bacterium]
MIKIKSKKLISCLIAFFVVILCASLLPYFRSPSLDTVKYPLKVFAFINREISAVIFYHRNFTENIRLRNENGLLRQGLNQAREYYLENQRLKGLLSFKAESPYRVIPCRVIGRDAASWSSVVIIDRGKSSGIKADMAVITSDGLAGRVIETGQFTSKAMLLNDPNMGVSALVQRSRQEGLVCGTWNNNLLVMRYLSSDADIKAGDVIVASGLSPLYPKGMLIGTVKEVGVDSSGLSLYAFINPQARLNALDEVLVVVR